ncbi:DMT family transporter [Allonocardiopsis opalescens]|uniref:Putative membrane protein n=1 Tax=Allonocardiopsis opalescens TaxID=1144618 RepID=A0A2T0Q5N0_9ACTN|nr:DMT family transporter [Allonocardiopsis opalescens]PRX99092.1 putative membrane protein [Allonocardiopsis opalescens]
MSIGITLALLAAVGYGAADFVGGAGARRAPTMSIVFIGQLTGAAAMVIVGLASPGTPTPADFGWALLAGLGSAAGSIFLLRGLSRGRMALVAPTSAVSAAVLPVLAGLAGGERPVALVWIGLVLALPGIWLVSRQVPDGAGPSSGGRGAFTDGLLGGLGFGVLFVALGQIPESAGTLPLAVNQLTGALVTIAVATVLRQTWRPGRGAAGWGITSGLLGASGSLAFVEAGHLADLGVVAVLASLYPAVTVLLARTLLGERLGAGQHLGLVCCSAAVGLIAAG